MARHDRARCSVAQLIEFLPFFPVHSEWTEEEEGLFYEKRNRKCIDEFVTITPFDVESD